MNKKQPVQPKPFDYLKGKDTEFQQAMKQIQNMYDDMFGDSQKYDSMFQTFKTQNNPITVSIDEMSKEIFDLDQPKNQNYVKIQPNTAENINVNVYEDDEQSVVFGEPIYMGGFQKMYQEKRHK